jgi:hypothetical protein
MLRTQISKERAGLGFREAAISAFAFLVKDFAFSCVQQQVTYVRYESNLVCVNVYHGRASFELNVEIGERVVGGDIRENPFTIGEILHFVNPEEAENYRPYQVSTTESVPKFVNELARLVKEYAMSALMGDHDFFQRVSEIRHQRSEELLRGWELTRVRGEVETAWNEKDLKRVIELYDPVKEYLSPSEIKKLEYAKKRSLS